MHRLLANLARTLRPSSVRDPALEPGSLLARMPPRTALALPADFAVREEQEPVSLADIVRPWADPAAHRQRLADWGFRRSAMRSYHLPKRTEQTIRSRMFSLAVQLTEFGSREQAIAAAEFQCHESVAQSTPAERVIAIPVAPIGDHALALQQALPRGHWTFWSIMVWVVDGPFVYRFTGIARRDSVPEITAVAEQTLAHHRQGAAG